MILDNSARFGLIDEREERLMQEVKSPITGKVVGFAIDFDDSKTKQWRVEFRETKEMRILSEQVVKEDQRLRKELKSQGQKVYGPMRQKFFTQYRRDDNGEVEEKEGVSVREVRVGDSVIRRFCHCGSSSFWEPLDSYNQKDVPYVCWLCRSLAKSASSPASS